MHTPNAQTLPSALPQGRGMALIRKVNRPMWLKAGFAAVVAVPGRTTGTPRQVTLIPWDVDGTWYLLSQYGASEWVQNLRTAGRCEMQHKGDTHAFRAVEVDGAERDRVIAVFMAKTPKPFRRDYNRQPAAGDHPAFRLEPLN